LTGVNATTGSTARHNGRNGRTVMSAMRSSGWRGWPRRHRLVVALAGTLLVGVGITWLVPSADATTTAKRSATTTANRSATPGRITFGACPAAAEGAGRDPREQCGTVKVPLDYRHPGRATIDVAVSRIASAKPAQRRGVLLLNPGGPALPGLDTPGTMAAMLPASVLDRYDLIGFDPRGVEFSDPQSCGLADPSLADLFPYPDANGSIGGNVTLARATAEKCAATAGPNLRFYTTADTARDIDRIRVALGEQKISYWGQSYGTYLGAVYGALFPNRTDRVVLEGNVDPKKVWARQTATWGKGMADRFPDAARVAAAQNATLGLGGTVAQVTDAYLRLADRLDRQPASLPGTPLALTGPMLRNVTYGLLLHNETLPVLAQFWKAATDLADGHLTDADTAVFQQILADSPSPAGVPADNQATLFLALTCGDVAWSRNIAGYAMHTAANRKKYPLTAGLPADVWPCAFWKYAPIEAPVQVTAHGPRNVLILQNRRDHATPWEAGIGLRQTLGHRAGFVGVDNGGHYVFHEGSACADQATVAFLNTGQLPDRDVYCTDVTQQ
jgi:pimeloyl-ACP methyl ester carboxylesterase